MRYLRCSELQSVTQSFDLCLTDFSKNSQKFRESSEDTWVLSKHPRILSNFLEASRSLKRRPRTFAEIEPRDFVDPLILILILSDTIVGVPRRCCQWIQSRTRSEYETRVAVRGSGDVATLDRRKLTTRSSAAAPRRRAPRRQVPRVRRPRRPLARGSPPRIFRSDAAAMCRDACCACSRAEGETTRKKLRRMHATVVRASLNSRVLVCVLRMRDNAPISR